MWPSVIGSPARVVPDLQADAQALLTWVRLGTVGVERPDRLLAMGRAWLSYGTLAGSITVAALRYGDRPGLVDDVGTLSFVELDRRSNALANAWRACGVAEGRVVGVMCRNHRGLLDAVFGAAKVGADVLLLNTGLAAPEAREVCAREGVDTLVCDAEFTRVVASADIAAQRRFIAWTGSQSGPVSGPPGPCAGAAAETPTLEWLIEDGDPAPPPATRRRGALVVLTSGTTGTPKGARRPRPEGFVLGAGVLSKVPLRLGQAVYVAPPIFHGLGLLVTSLTLALGGTVVTARRFQAQDVLERLAERRCAGLVVVPVMLKRVLDLGQDTVGGYDLSALRVILSGGAELGGSLLQRATSAFGEVVYNLYGTTEAACAAIATPADLRAAPACVGRPPLGTTVKILDAQSHTVPHGVTGTIHVRNISQFSGYTGGDRRQAVDGLMSTGDLGHFDAAGRLFVDGRADEMIVSGGENVFPGEVEDLLAGHPAIADAAVIGVPDEEFGQVLRAFVVRRPGHRLSADDVREYARSRLARHKVPRTVVFVAALPRAATGKVRTRELAGPHGRGSRWPADGLTE